MERQTPASATKMMLTLLLAAVMLSSGCFWTNDGGISTQKGTFELKHGQRHYFELPAMIKARWNLTYLSGNATVDVLFMNATSFAALLKKEDYGWETNLSALNVTSANMSNQYQAELEGGLYYLVVFNPSRENPNATGTVKFHLLVDYWG